MDRGADPVRHRSAVSIVIGTRKSASARRSAYAKFSVYDNSPSRVSSSAPALTLGSGCVVGKPDITPKRVSQLSSQGADRFVIRVYPNFQFAPLIADGVPSLHQIANWGYGGWIGSPTCTNDTPPPHSQRRFSVCLPKEMF
jgi:hypothetical protein